jgi:predicted nucleotidyltransferase
MERINSVCPKLNKLINGLYSEEKVAAVFLCGSRSKKQNRVDSDYDLLLINEWDLGDLQVIHYDLNGLLLDCMLLNTKFLFSEDSDKKRLLKVLLKNSILIFSKVPDIKSRVKNILHEKKKLPSSMEFESIWYNILWNLKKSKSVSRTNRLLSEALCIEAYYFIGLFFAKLNHQEIYNFLGSLNFMRIKDPDFFHKYVNIKSKHKLRELNKLIKRLPGFEKYSSVESYVELDGFISPHTVIKDKNGIKCSVRKKIDNLVFRNLKK